MNQTLDIIVLGIKLQLDSLQIVVIQSRSFRADENELINTTYLN